MRLIHVLALVLLANAALAQQPFQGTIAYNLHTPQEKKDAELLVFYGPNKIKVKFKEKEEYDKTFLLIDLDSGKFITVDTEAKTFLSKKLFETATGTNVANSKTIAGYTTNPVNVSGGLGFLGISGNTVLYTAPDLFFPIPQKYATTPQLIMINNNHIVLGADIKMGIPGTNEELPDSVMQQMKVSVEATKITPQVFNIAEFSIPGDYTKRSSNYMPSDPVDIIADSTMAQDTIAVPPAVKKDTKGNPKPSTPKKKVQTKSEAIKPKKTPNKS